MENMDFKQFIAEESEKTAAFAFGRFNPPTVGHEKLLNKVKEEAKTHGAEAHVVTSHSEGTAKNPIPQKAKIGYLKKVAGPHLKVSGSSKEAPSVLDAATHLHKQGYKHLVMVAGSDRVDEYHKLLHKYNDVPSKHGHYNFKSIKVVSAGQRDPDAEGVEGMSGTKMRAHAKAGEMDKFKSGLPVALHPHAEEIANHIKSIKEDFENPYRHDWGTPEGTLYMQKMTPGQENITCPIGSIWSKETGKCVPIREAYHADEIFNLGNIVETKNGDIGEIVYRGSSYVTIQLESGNTTKHWINDIKESNKILQIKDFPRTVKENNQLRKIPALLMSKAQLAEVSSMGMEVEYNGYQTHNLHMCPGASSQLKDVIKTSTANSKYILQAIQATDKYLGLEQQAKDAKFANEKTLHDFGMFVAIAHDTLNMLGYPDEKLLYISNHVKDMGKLAMHKDGTIANETGSTIPEFGAGSANEGVNASDFKMVSRIGPDGKPSWVKERNNRIITDREMNNTTKDNQDSSIKKLALSAFKKSIGMVGETYLPDPPTATRDVNARPEKEVYHGIDIPIADQGYPDKPLGLASFKSFLSTPQTQNIEAAKGKDMEAVHRDKAQLAMPSPAYKQMIKVHAQDN